MESIEKNEVGCGCGNSGGCGCETATSAAEAREVAGVEAPRRAYVPAVDLIDSEGEVVLVADVPGVGEGGVDLTIEKNILTLTAVPSDGVIAGKRLVYSEYGVGEYRRSFSLSEDVDREGITATLKDGVLRVRLPKRASVTRKISVVTT